MSDNNSAVDFNRNLLKLSNKPLPEYGGKSEAELVDMALQGTTLLELAKTCLVSFAKRKYQSNQPTNKDGSERKRDTANQVQDKIHALVIAQMAENDKAKNWYEKRAINSSWIQKGGKEDVMARSTGMTNIYGFQSVKVYLSTYESDIQEHHRKHSISGNFNQKVSNELKRIAKSGK